MFVQPLTLACLYNQWHTGTTVHGAGALAALCCATWNYGSLSLFLGTIDLIVCEVPLMSTWWLLASQQVRGSEWSCRGSRYLCRGRQLIWSSSAHHWDSLASFPGHSHLQYLITCSMPGNETRDLLGVCWKWIGNVLHCMACSVCGMASVYCRVTCFESGTVLGLKTFSEWIPCPPCCLHTLHWALIQYLICPIVTGL